MAKIAINRDSISSNYNRLRGHVRKTPVLQLDPGDLGVRAGEVHLKLELFQHTGSFKPRGAFTHFFTDAIPQAGVVAASGGNHGAAVAFAARAFNKPATIFVPEIASAAKLQVIRSLGADLRIGGSVYADALAAANEHVETTGAQNLHAYDQPETLIGQGSVGLEIETQVPGAQTILVAVGGGGLIGGIAAWYQGRSTIIAVEPETSNALAAASQAGAPVEVDVSGIAADSLGARRVGELAFPLCRSYVEQTLTVPDEAIQQAQSVLWQTARVVAEPGGATALAALICGAYVPSADERIAVVVCGANTTALPAMPEKLDA